MDLHRAVHAIQSIHEFAMPGRTLKSSVNRAYAAGGRQGAVLKAALRGKWLGHPLHPTVTDIPIGVWTLTLIFDLLRMHRAADVSVTVGLIGAAASIATGLTDYSEADASQTNVGLVHAALNSSATLCFGVSLVARLKERRSVGTALSLAGYGLLAAGSYLGGELVFTLSAGHGENV